MSQLKKEISMICDIPINEVQHTDFSEYLIQFLLKPHSDILAVKLIFRFDNSFTKSTKDFLCITISQLLANPHLSVQSPKAFRSPAVILTDLIIDTTHQKYNKFIDFLHYAEWMLGVEDSEISLFSIVKELSHRCSTVNLFDNFMIFVTPLLILADFQSVQDVLNDPDMWVADMSTSIFNTLELETYNKKRCFLFGFLELFIYNEKKRETFDRYVDLETQTAAKKKELTFSILNKLDKLHSTLYSFLIQLFNKNLSIRLLFQKFLISVIKKNNNRANSIVNVMVIDRDAVMFNLNGILSKFCLKLDQKKTYVLINPAFLYNFEDELIDTNIGIHKNEDVINNFESCIFFCKLKFMQLGVLKISTMIISLDNVIYDMESNLAFLTRQTSERNEKEKTLKWYKSNRAIYNLLSSFDFSRNEAGFFEFVSSYLFVVCGQTLSDFYNKNSIDNSLAKLSLKSIITEKSKEKPQKATDRIVCSVKTFPEYIYTLLFVFQMMSKKVSNSYMYLAGEILKTDMPILSIKQSLVKTFNYVETIHLLPPVFSGSLRYYIELERLDDFEFEKIDLQNMIIDTLSIDSSNSLVLLNMTNSVHIHFLHTFLKNIKRNLSAGLLAIQEINDFNVNKTKIPKDFIKEKEIKFSENEHKARNFYNHLNLYLIFLLRLIRTCRCNIFENVLITDAFVGVLNCTLKIIFGPEFCSLKILGMIKYNIEPEKIVGLIIDILLVMDKRCALTSNKSKDRIFLNWEVFLEHIIADPIYFSLDVYLKFYNLCKAFYLMRKQELSKIKKLIEALFMMYAKKTTSENKSSSTIDIPGEFIDPITFSVMERPVKLHTSEKIVDFETAETIILGDCLDPFNREVLSREKITEELELKKKIKEWHNQQK
ncbi:Ubiquitin conjugation factor E4 [Cucumispora dikerogammari]|nr:Ubiquitin conjugation factor E4 [Cucumispora dikerogammari]